MIRSFSCLLVETLSTANRGRIFQSLMSAKCHTPLPTSFEQPREIALAKKSKQGNVELITDKFYMYNP